MVQQLYVNASRTGPNSPNIIGRYNAPGWNPPTRIYFHESGFSEAFNDNPSFQPWVNALTHLSRIFDSKLDQSHDLRNFNYAIAFLWGQEKDKMVDLFAYDAISRWPGNPSISSFIFRNGVYEPDNHEIGCGDGSIVICVEEEYRRKCKNLQYFLQNPPEIPGAVFS
jgi:hypothetical protein